MAARHSVTASATQAFVSGGAHNIVDVAVRVHDHRALEKVAVEANLIEDVFPLLVVGHIHLRPWILGPQLPHDLLLLCARSSLVPVRQVRPPVFEEAEIEMAGFFDAAARVLAKPRLRSAKHTPSSS